jgi:hypothetical protein
VKAPIHWQWQLRTSFNPARDLLPHVDVYDIDGFAATARTVAAIHGHHATAICYVDVGTWEQWRPDASVFPRGVLGAANGWPGERWLDIRRVSVLRPIMASRLAMCKSKGFDAVEPDNIDGYANATGFSLSAQDQLTYDLAIADLAHRLGLSVGQKNDLDQAGALEPSFDWLLDEQCRQYDECDALQPYLGAGKAVFEVEYGSATDQCPALTARHVNSMTRDLNLVSPATAGYVRKVCLPDTQSAW